VAKPEGNYTTPLSADCDSALAPEIVARIAGTQPAPPAENSDGQPSIKSVSRGNPCPLCEGTDGCSIGADSLFLCRRREGPQAGFICLGPARRDPQWTLYRREGDPLLSERDGRPQPNVQHKPPADWQVKADALAAKLTPTLGEELAGTLGLPLAVLGKLPLLGFCPDGPHKDKDTRKSLGACWTFPEVDGAGRVIGLTCRYRDGCKKAWPEGKRGLTVPGNWRERNGPVFLPEGPSDTLALTALGLSAVGRPSNTGGVEHLAEFLRDVPKDRPLIVLGELDPNDKGGWPGRDGALKTARALAEKLGRPVQWALPPDGAKDVRAWVLSFQPEPAWDTEWFELRAEWLNVLKPLSEKAVPPEGGASVDSTGQQGGQPAGRGLGC
jgi:hypothetical protein